MIVVATKTATKTARVLESVSEVAIASVTFGSDSDDQE